MDKQDELARVIGDACWEKWGDGPWGTATEQVECQAAAVRSFMGSPDQARQQEGAAMWRCGVSDTIVIIDRLRKQFETQRGLKRNIILAHFDAELEILLNDWFKESRTATPTSHNEAFGIFKAFMAERAALSAAIGEDIGGGRA